MSSVFIEIEEIKSHCPEYAYCDFLENNNYYDTLKKIKNNAILKIEYEEKSPLTKEWLLFLKNDLLLDFSFDKSLPINQLVIETAKHNKLSLYLTIELIKYVFTERDTILKTFKWLKDSYKLEPIQLLQYSHYTKSNKSVIMKNEKIMTQKQYFHKLKNHKYITFSHNDNYDKIKKLIMNRSSNIFINYVR